MDSSTFKILNKLHGKKKSNPVAQEAAPIDTPRLQPQPASEMAQALSNILGPSFKKDLTPLD